MSTRNARHCSAPESFCRSEGLTAAFCYRSNISWRGAAAVTHYSRTCNIPDYETLGTLPLKMEWDERDAGGIGCFSVFITCGRLSLFRVCRLMNYDIYDVIFYLYQHHHHHQ